MNLSKPLIKALANMGMATPTKIQSATIPTALKGKDICACAVTGSGKTLAFMLPTLERLLYKPKFSQVTRVLVLTPTRELAVQICKVTRDLTQFTNINTCLCAGNRTFILFIKLKELTVIKCNEKVALILNLKKLRLDLDPIFVLQLQVV